MNYDIQLNFAVELLQEMHISSHTVTNPKERISSKIDLGLREMLFDVQN